eukprot:gene35204-45592_t
MHWEPLDLAKASALKKEVDAIVAHFELIPISSANGSFVDAGGESNLLPMLHSINERISQLESFCTIYGDDDRAILFEKQRLRLRKLVQTYGSTIGSNSSAHSTNSHTPARSRAATPPQTPSPFLSHQPTQSFVQPTSAAPSLGLHMYSAGGAGGGSGIQTPRSITSVAKKPIAASSSSAFPSSSASAPRSRPSPSPSQQPAKIYTWESTEGGRSAQQRQPIEVDGVIFDPSSTEGFYSRRTNQHPVEGRDGEGDAAFSEYTSFNSKYMDFQVILTNEELTALAARKRADRRDIKSDKSQAASASPLTASPYIEPRRIRDALLRPDQPEKWIGSAGIALGPYQKH